MIEAALLPIAALVAGGLSFASPCCLPLVPGYVSYISGLPASDATGDEARDRALRASLLFVAGFTVVFVALGLAASAMGSAILRNRDELVRAFGVMIIAMGLAGVGVLRIPVLRRERRVDLARVPRGPAWALPLGMAFAAGWTPCIGPVLATLLATAAAGGSTAWGGVLLACYSIGLGVPFVALALGMTRASGSVAWLRRNGQRIEMASGALMVVVGVLFVTGRWTSMFRPFQRWLAEVGWPPI